MSEKSEFLPRYARCGASGAIGLFQTDFCKKGSAFLMSNDYKVAQIEKCKMTSEKRYTPAGVIAESRNNGNTACGKNRGIRPQALKHRGKPTLRFMRMRGVGYYTFTRRKQETHFERF